MTWHEVAVVRGDVVRLIGNDPTHRKIGESDLGSCRSLINYNRVLGLFKGIM